MIMDLIHDDCLRHLRTMPDKAFRLAIVDPPYGIGEDGSKGRTRGSARWHGTNYRPFSGNDKEPPPAEYFRELMRVSENQIIWGANHFISRMPYDSHCWIVWDKVNGDSDFADCELAWTSFPGAVRIIHYRWSGFMQNNMKCREKRIHPTQKPVELYAWIMNRFAKPGDNILDTHLGSGSSAIAAYNLGFDFTGIELDDFYFEAAKKRVKECMDQGKLF